MITQALAALLIIAIVANRKRIAFEWYDSSGIEKFFIIVFIAALLSAFAIWKFF